jgi:hypothetical protein
MLMAGIESFCALPFSGKEKLLIAYEHCIPFLENEFVSL